MTHIQINVLIIEDNAVDAVLIKKILRDKAGLFSVDSAACLSDGLKHMGEKRFDVIILDLSLPDSTGIETFLKVQERMPQVPVIMLTGLDDEDTAMLALRKGAQDYLVKGTIGQHLLIRSLKYAIERKRIEEELRASEERIRAFSNALPDFAFVVDEEGCFVEILSPDESYFHHDSRQLIGKYLNDVFPEKQAKAFWEIVRETIRSQKPQKIEYELTSNEQKKWFEARTSLICNSLSEKQMIVWISRDISERKQIEKERLYNKKLQGAFEMAGAVCHELNQPLQFISGTIHLALMDLQKNDSNYKTLYDIKQQSDKMGAMTRKLMRITTYKTRDYISGRQIIDIDKSSED